MAILWVPCPNKHGVQNSTQPERSWSCPLQSPRRMQRWKMAGFSGDKYGWTIPLFSRKIMGHHTYLYIYICRERESYYKVYVRCILSMYVSIYIYTYIYIISYIYTYTLYYILLYYIVLYYSIV